MGSTQLYCLSSRQNGYIQFLSIGLNTSGLGYTHRTSSKSRRRSLHRILQGVNSPKPWHLNREFFSPLNYRSLSLTVLVLVLSNIKTRKLHTLYHREFYIRLVSFRLLLYY